VIAKPLGNETVRHLLGQSTWRLIHTTMARFPLMPSENEKQALSQFLFLLSRLYPCGDCAEHFQKLLHEFPPNLNTRYEAELWACEAHNKVNKRLEKELLDCTTVHSLYDCGC
ncbi:ERV/ALR sulfhydryl oxidase domain-containing protein, partial [Dimargaris cristalligena]